MSKHTPEPWKLRESWEGVIPVDHTGEYDSIFFQVGNYDTPACSKEDGERIVACVNACTGMEDPEKEIAELKEKVSAEYLYKIFSESFQVNEYRSVWQGEWPELQFYIHEIWKRDPVVTQLRSENQVMRDALERIAKQHNSQEYEAMFLEMDEDSPICGCEFQDGFDGIILTAREALAKVSGKEEG